MKHTETDENSVLNIELERSITPLTHIKSTGVLLKNNNNRLPLASKDNNRHQNFLNTKRNSLKRHASNSNIQNLSDNKLKKYNSSLGVNFPTLSKTKSLVLKDVETEEEEDNDNILAIKLRNKLKSNIEGEEEQSSGLLNGLMSQGDIDNVDNEPFDIEFIPEKIPELPHIPNGHNPFKDQELLKLSKYESPFIRDNNNSDDETDSETNILPLNLCIPISKSISTNSDEFLLDQMGYNFESNVSSDNINEIEFCLSEEYHGKGLNNNELESLVD